MAGDVRCLVWRAFIHSKQIWPSQAKCITLPANPLYLQLNEWQCTHLNGSAPVSFSIFITFNLFIHSKWKHTLVNKGRKRAYQRWHTDAHTWGMAVCESVSCKPKGVPRYHSLWGKQAKGVGYVLIKMQKHLLNGFSDASYTWCVKMRRLDRANCA